MNKLISKIVGVALGLTLAAGTGTAIAVNSNHVVKTEAATETLIIDGAQLNSTATTADTDKAYGDYTICFSSGAKQQASSGSNKFANTAILIGKSGAYLYNKTALPDNVTKFEIYSNAGASTKVSIGVNFSATALSAYDSTLSTTYTATLSTADSVYDCTSKLASGTKYFWYQVTNANNSQVQFRITYTSSGSGSSGVDVTFTPGVDTGATSVTKQGVTATMTTMNNASYYQIYANDTGTFASTNGNITKITFDCTASGTAKYGPGNITANVGSYSYSGATGTWTGDAASVELTSTAQVRMTILTVTYASSGSVSPTNIACSAQSINVTESVNLSSEVTFTPSGTTETGLSFAIKSGSDKIDLNASTGVVTGKKGGNAVVTITPSDTTAGAQAIDVTITVSSISAPGITVGNQYVVYGIDQTNGNYELTGVSGDYGTPTSFTGNIPACSYVLTTENGYFENTVAFKNGSSYLSLNSNDNKLNTKSTVDADSSWIVTWDSTTNAAVLENAGRRGRTLQFNYNNGNARFACYSSSQVAISLYPYVEQALTDFAIDTSISVYKTGTATIGVTYTPADAADKTLNWSSSNTAIATVADGVVTGVAAGECTITASKVISGSTVSRTCTVTVLNNAAAHKGSSDDPFDANDAHYVALGILVENSQGTAINLSNEYYVKAQITATVAVTKSKLTFWVGDNANQISAATGGFEVYQAGKVYGESLSTYSTNLSDNDVKRDFAVGNIVTIKSTLTAYNGTPETSNGAADIIYSSYIVARHYAEAFNTALEAVCDADGNTVASDLASAWSSQATAYSALTSAEKSAFDNVQGNANGYAIQKCIAKYDYIIGKYNTTTVTTYADFMGRVASGDITLNEAHGMGLAFISNNNALIIVLVTAFVGITFVGGYFFLRKKKEQ